ncbi:integrase core domain-containing protein [Rhodococcus sp. NPDC058532]|uniref:integrase core domain-containing protein n=1 Tax=Rhodococcus sp. NPDC058532 TaxID=3346540 RepID=UPI0036529852
MGGPLSEFRTCRTVDVPGHRGHLTARSLQQSGMGGKGFSMNPDIVAAVAQHTGGTRVNVSRLCREHGISRNTFYTLVNRFRDEGAGAFTTRSTRPHTSPTTTAAHVCEAIVRARKELDDEGLDNGPISIVWRHEDEGLEPVPSRSTVYRVLTDRGLIVPQPRKRPRTRRRFEFAEPNGCWQIDGLEHYLADGSKVCILQVLDDHSRLDVCSYAARAETSADAWAALERAMDGHGIPANLLSDNGLAFSGKHRGSMAEIERNLAALGTSVAHPQTCGKNERAHRTLRKWLSKQPPAATLAQLQVQLDHYREVYNNRRHQGIGGMTPKKRWEATPPAHPVHRKGARSGCVERSVSGTGVVQFDGLVIVIGRRYKNTTAAVYWQGDRVTVMIGDTIARSLTLDRTTRYQKLSSKS